MVHAAGGPHLTGAALMHSTHPSALLAIFENQRRRSGALRSLCGAGPTQLYFGVFACLRNIFPLRGHKDLLLYFLLEV